MQPWLEKWGPEKQMVQRKEVEGGIIIIPFIFENYARIWAGWQWDSCSKQKEVVYITVPLIPKVKCELNRYRCFKKYLFLLLKPDWVLMFDTSPRPQIICIILYFLQPPVHPYRNG